MSDEREHDVGGEVQRIDALTQQLAELQTTVKEHLEAQDRATLDMDALAKTLADLLEQREAARQPVRRMANDVQDIPPDDRRQPARTNRYDVMLQAKAVSPLDLWMARRVMEGAHRVVPGMAPPPSRDLADAVQKLMTATGSGVGDELVPTGMASAIWEDFFLQARLVSQIVPPIAMPTDPFNVDTLGDPTWRKGTEGEATSSSDLATANVTFTSTELLTSVNWSRNLDEDAVIALMPNVRANIARTGAEQMDAFLLNADATNAASGNINSDDATPATDAYYLSNGLDGIRHLYIVDNTDQHINAGGDALADADIQSAIKAMGKYAVDPTSCVIVPEPKTYLSMLALTSVATVDKYGQQAGILTGEVARYQGIPVIVSASQPLAEADGKVSATASNNTLGTMSIFNRNMWGVGFRRQLMIEVAWDMDKRVFRMVASFRIAVGCRGTRSSATHTAGIRNILV